jgi:hypothetical protein
MECILTWIENLLIEDGYVTETTIYTVSIRPLRFHSEKELTYVCNGYIFSQHPETSEAPGTCTPCRNSKQMGELQGNEEGRRTLQYDFGPEFQIDTICM